MKKEHLSYGYAQIKKSIKAPQKVIFRQDF